MIHDLIMQQIKEELEEGSMFDVDPSDNARTTLVMLGPLQGDPDPDDAAIFITIHENDPNDVIGDGANAGSMDSWQDEVFDIEIGGAITWKRYFTVRARCLLVNDPPDLDEARLIASKLRKRMERTILTADFSAINTGTEYVSRGALGYDIESEVLQAGGPESYDFHITIHFGVLTTEIL